MSYSEEANGTMLQTEHYCTDHNVHYVSDNRCPKCNKRGRKAEASRLLGVSSGEWVECPCCSGTGHVMRYPYYSNIMPELAEKPCEECGGRGRFFVIPDDCFTITISEARRHSTARLCDGE